MSDVRDCEADVIISGLQLLSLSRFLKSVFSLSPMLRRSNPTPKAWVDRYLKQIESLRIEYWTLVVSTAGLNCQQRAKRARDLILSCRALGTTISKAKNLDYESSMALSEKSGTLTRHVQGYIMYDVEYWCGKKYCPNRFQYGSAHVPLSDFSRGIRVCDKKTGSDCTSQGRKVDPWERKTGHYWPFPVL